MFQVKPISVEGLARSLEKAHRYRLLNEPAEAESICLDILEIDPHNREVLITLLLAKADQFGSGGKVEDARKVLSRLEDPYEQAYYGGIICERRAKAIMQESGPNAHFIAYDWFVEAMKLYENAEAIRPPGNEDSILRWNTCARILMSHPEIRPEPIEERYEPPLE